MKTTSQIIAENPRIVWAVLGSMLLHASLISPWLTARTQPQPSRPFETVGFAASLVARIAGVKQEQEVSRSDPRPAPKKPLVAPRPPVVVEPPAPAFVSPVEEGDATESEVVAASADAGEGEGDAEGQRGVSVTETLLHRSPPPHVRKRLSEFPGYFMSQQLTRRPEALDMVLPRYPAKQLAARSATWILVALLIDEKGKVVAAIPVDGDEFYEEFQDQVVAALQESSFKAGERFGLPVKSLVFQMVEFRPQKAPADAPSSGMPSTAAP